MSVRDRVRVTVTVVNRIMVSVVSALFLVLALRNSIGESVRFIVREGLVLWLGFSLGLELGLGLGLGFVLGLEFGFGLG